MRGVTSFGGQAESEHESVEVSSESVLQWLRIRLLSSRQVDDSSLEQQLVVLLLVFVPVSDDRGHGLHGVLSDRRHEAHQVALDRTPHRSRAKERKARTRCYGAS